MSDSTVRYTYKERSLIWLFSLPHASYDLPRWGFCEFAAFFIAIPPLKSCLFDLLTRMETEKKCVKRENVELTVCSMHAGPWISIGLLFYSSKEQFVWGLNYLLENHGSVVGEHATHKPPCNLLLQTCEGLLKICCFR